MNFLNLLPKRTISKIKDVKYDNQYFFGYDKKVVHGFDARKVVISDYPGTTSMSILEILNDNRE